MKKFFKTFLLVLLVTMCASVFVSAQADDEIIDTIRDMLKDASDEEIVAVKNVLTEELKYRKLQGENAETNEEVKIPAGEYTIGVDIPAGAYTISLAGNSFMAMLTVYSSTGQPEDIHTVTHESPIGRYEFKYQQTISIVGSSLMFSQYKGLDF